MDPDLSDPASFAHLLGSGLPIPSYMSKQDVSTKASQLSSRIFSSHSRLNEVVIRHEATLRKRWSKKKRQQKLDVLLMAWPRMPAQHRPDLDAFRKEPAAQREQNTQHRDAYMFPYINQEDLLQSKNLLLLINSRSRQYPCRFAAADYDAMHFGIATKAIVPIFLNEFTMLLNGASSQKDYGRLLSWDEHPDAFDWMHSQRQYSPGDGLITLEAQDRLLAFLLDCCNCILHDVAADESFSIQPEPTFVSMTESEGYESLAVMAQEAPYRVPARMDLLRLESVLQARVSRGQDHLVFLREDPGYFAEYIQDFREHRQECIGDTEGKPHAVCLRGQEHILLARIVGSLIMETYVELEVFSQLLHQVRDTRAIYDKCVSDLDVSRSLPQPLLFAVLKFRHSIDKFVAGFLATLKENVPASPPLRHIFVRQRPLDPQATKMRILSRNVRRSRIENQLIWLLQVLWENDDQLFLMRMPLVLDELERLLQAEPSAKDLTSARIASVIGDLSIIAQCQIQISLFQPWARSLEDDAVQQQDILDEGYAKKNGPLRVLVGALHKTKLRNAGKLADPSHGRFRYPSEKRKTKENVNALRLAEENLDKFWNHVDERLKQSGFTSESMAARKTLATRPIMRTPHWTEPHEEPAKAGRAQSSDVPAAEVIQKPLTALHIGDTAETPQLTKLPSGVKSKTKTRGEKDAFANQKTVIPALARSRELEMMKEQEHFEVDARSLKVFRTLFHNPDITSSPGEVSWADFLHAMVSTELFSAEKLYGSVWQFQRNAKSDQSRIQFHEPHPKGKMSFWQARRYGRRLTRAYGWSGNIFVLKGI